jgi:hypothetical protein
MAKQAKAAMGASELQAIADRGYFNGDEILACEKAGITPFVSKPMTSSAKAEGRFDKDDFIYDPQSDEYICPGGSRLIWRFAREEDGYLISRYWSSDCPRCAIRRERSCFASMRAGSVQRQARVGQGLCRERRCENRVR